MLQNAAFQKEYFDCFSEER